MKINYSAFVYLCMMITSTCCNSKDYQKSEKIGKTINLITYAVEIKYSASNGKGNKKLQLNKPFKIVTYGNYYCKPCWAPIPQWNEYYYIFKKYENVEFLCYVHASDNDFEENISKLNLKFNVLLDKGDRFSIVNRLGSIAEKNTFLLNDKNEILVIGLPFTEKKMAEYIAAIEGQN